MKTTSPEKKRTYIVTFRMSGQERDLLDAEAERRDVNVCDVIRELLEAQDWMNDEGR